MMAKSHAVTWRVWVGAVLLLLPLVFVGILSPWFVRLRQTEKLKQRDFVAEWNEVRGEIATADDPVWWGDLRGCFTLANNNDQLGTINGFEPELQEDFAAIKGWSEPRYLWLDVGFVFDEGELLQAIGEYDPQSDDEHPLDIEAYSRFAIERYSMNNGVDRCVEMIAAGPNAVPPLRTGDYLGTGLGGWSYLGFPVNTLAEFEEAMLRQAMRDGDWFEAAGRYQRMLGLSRSVGWEPSLFKRFSAGWTEMMATDAMREELALLDEVDQELLALVLDTLAEHDGLVDDMALYRRALRGDVIYEMSFILKLFDAPKWDDEGYTSELSGRDIAFLATPRPAYYVRYLEKFEEQVNARLDEIGAMDIWPEEKHLASSDLVQEMEEEWFEMLFTRMDRSYWPEVSRARNGRKEFLLWLRERVEKVE
ncbi:MAG: hypothetical protein AAGB34_06300 [Planctomycetota bacterium]